MTRTELMNEYRWRRGNRRGPLPNTGPAAPRSYIGLWVVLALSLGLWGLGWAFVRLVSDAASIFSP